MPMLAHYKEAHPLPFVVTHYINLGCMVVLLLSGIIIHFPYLAGFTGVARGAHIFCGIVILLNCIVRVILSFVLDSAPAGGTRQMQKDYKTWMPQVDNRHQLASWLKYYFIIKKDRPLSGKYNPLQKTTYLLIPLCILFMGLTGLCLWSPTMNWGICQAFTGAVGGLMSVRIIHYFMMFFFIIFIIIHVYMVSTEGGLSLIKLMFTRKEHGGLTYDINTHALSGEDESI